MEEDEKWGAWERQKDGGGEKMRGREKERDEEEDRQTASERAN